MRKWGSRFLYYVSKEWGFTSLITYKSSSPKFNVYNLRVFYLYNKHFIIWFIKKGSTTRVYTRKLRVHNGTLLDLEIIEKKFSMFNKENWHLLEKKTIQRNWFLLKCFRVQSIALCVPLLLRQVSTK